MKRKYLLLTIILFMCLFLFSATSLALIPGDFDGDNVVGFEDLMIFAMVYGSCEGDINWNPVCDLDGDGCIEFEDLMIFAMHYGECTPPSAPILSDPGTTLPSPATYTVSWTPVTGAKSYVLQEDKSSSFSRAQEYILSDTSKSFKHTVTTSTTYYYRVAAVNSCGQSDWSNIENIIVNCCTFPSAPTLFDPGGTLPAPANYTVSWTAVSEATSYILQEATSFDFTSGLQEYPVTGTRKSFSHTVITTYYYRVASINDCGQGSWSNIVDIQICPCTPPSPPTLSDPGDTLTSPATYTVSWSAVSEATSYILQEATSSIFTGAQEYTLSSTSKDFSHTVTTTTYYYRVAAVDYCGPSGWSNVENITVVTGPVHNLTKDTYYKTIQEALYDADSSGGDTIEVPDGTYDESITFPSAKKITLQSVNGPSSTIIRGNDDSTTVDFQNSLEDTTLEGFTITHNSWENGKGIYISEGFLIIDNCVISGNTSDYADHGGGIYNNGGTLTITSSTISGNTADDRGGGIYNKYGGTLTITSSTISGNTSNDRGGGIYNNGTLTITSSTISNNTANYEDGGGIFNFAAGTLTITSSTISSNTATGHGGGGIDNHDGTLDITSTTISGNTADYGGGIYNFGTLTITSSTISGNTADYWGGGICNKYGGTLTITSSTISGNTASHGGGIYNIFGTLTITSSIISGNNVTGSGGGIYLAETETITIGGSHWLDFGNFNAFTYNKKDGTISAAQHIRDSSGDCHLSYPNNNYNPN